MPRFELTMNTHYASSWGVWEGVREVVQNALDGQDDGFPMVVTWVEHKGAEYLSISNKGKILDKAVWLLGHSEKGSSDSRGRHGDGLKVGTLALVRMGVPVFFLNGNERWSPALERSETFGGETVLTINTRAGSARENDFTVLLGISREMWDRYRQRFLAFADIDQDLVVKGGYAGDLIQDPRFKGKLFVKGIWVCDHPEFDNGYDLRDVTIDRDRRILDSWDVKIQTGKIFNLICGEGREAREPEKVAALTAALYQGLASGTADGEKLYYYVDESLKSKIAEMFRQNHGENAVAVRYASEATKLEHFGLRGVVVEDGLFQVMEKVQGSTDEILAKALQTTGAYVARGDLTEAECAVWDLAVNAVSLFGEVDVDLESTRIFEFAAPGAPRGTFDNATGEIRISRATLANQGQTIVTLAHEIAHRNGQDGTVDHREAQDKILVKVLNGLAEQGDLTWLK